MTSILPNAQFAGSGMYLYILRPNTQAAAMQIDGMNSPVETVGMNGDQKRKHLITDGATNEDPRFW